MSNDPRVTLKHKCRVAAPVTLKYKRFSKQECIPVGCVPAARRPYAGVCFPGEVCSVGCLVGGRVSAPGGSAPRRGVCLLQGGVWSRGGCLLGGVSAPRGGSVCSRGVSAPGGGVSQHALRQTPSPPVDRILDTHLWKYYLGPTSLRPVMKVKHFRVTISTQLKYCQTWSLESI